MRRFPILLVATLLAMWLLLAVEISFAQVTFGLLLAVLAAIVYILAEIDPTVYSWAILVPAVLSLIVGFGQEWMYGARS